MNLMVNLKTTTGLVKAILEEDEKARNSDSYLYLRVLEEVGEQQGIYFQFWTVHDLLMCMADYNLPPFESVRRTRQKIQQTYPHLAACKKVEEQRTANEEVYRAYAQGVQNV